MEFDLVDICGAEGSPVGLAGCRAENTCYESCAYDVVVFDTIRPTDILTCSEKHVFVHHTILPPHRPQEQATYNTMRLLSDDELRLAPILHDIQQRSETIFNRCAQGCLVDALMYAARSDCDDSDMASCWQNCAAVCLADAAVYLERHTPSSHTLDILRRQNPKIASIIADAVGVERASRTLINRMSTATMSLIEAHGDSAQMVNHRVSMMLHDGRLADCYLYMCGMGRTALAAMPNDATVQYAAHIMMDAERDMSRIRDATSRIRTQATAMLEAHGGALVGNDTI